jgi:L-threonylcarbamoyladenylate synthase
VRTEVLQSDDPDHLARAAALLVAGEVVAFSTETVYGLGVRGDDAEAVGRLYDLKGRPRDRKFTLLIASPDDMCRYAAPGPAARRLAERLWPGPLTLVVSDGKGGDVGLRCPDHAATRRMLQLAGMPVAAPSANLTGRQPATSAAEVLEVFKGRIAAVVDGGPARIGSPSTVVRVGKGGLEVLRAGALSESELHRALDGLA